MNNTNKQYSGTLARRLGQCLLAGACAFASASWAQSASVNAVKLTSSGERTDRLVIEFTGREPALGVETIDGSLVVTLKGASLSASVPRNQMAPASLGVMESAQAAAQGSNVEINVQPKVKAWTYTAMQTRRNVVIEFVAAAVQPAEPAMLMPLPVAVAPAVEPVSPAATEAAPTRRADKPCIECHEGFYSITKTKHYVRSDSRTPGSKGEAETAAECAACHGDLEAHQRTPRTKGLVPITYGKKSAPGPQNEACLACHQGGTRIHWEGSAHDRAQQSCSSCHRLHAPKDPVMVTETQASVCFDCHKDRRAEMHRMSTHPTKTGFISCSSCHASHGSNTRASLQKATVNQTCYQCHADKRGPFLWEHRPSTDDCTNCHNPHGTNNPPMLKVRQPFLCQQCHSTAFHGSLPFSGTDATVTGTNSHRVLGNSCANCHVKVHGTNHPSGARLQR